MMRNLTVLILIPVAVAIVAGCDDGTISSSGDDQGGVSAAVMADVLLQSDVMTEEVLNAELDAINAASPATSGSGSGTIIKDVTFSRTRSCAGGGQFSVEGTIHRTLDLETRVMEAESSGTRTRTDCTYGGQEMTHTVNSDAHWDLFRRRVDGRPDGLQTSHIYGSLTVSRSDGEERSCEYDIEIVRDPATHTRTLDGVICGTEVHRSVTWSYEE